MKEYPLNKERTTIGRKPHNDIVIDNLAVSSEHAAIVTILNDSFLEDLDSTNGLAVNGTPTKKHFLQNNDVIEIGKYKLKYLNDQPTQTSAADFEKTMVLRAPVKVSHVEAASKSPLDVTTTRKTEAVISTQFNATNNNPAGEAAGGTPPAALVQILNRPQFRQRTRVGEKSDHPGQAGRTGGSIGSSSARLFHYPCGRRQFPHGERFVHRRATAPAERP